ncbi:hypothetical protein [Methylacidiphilum kamchatkense]|nr:hypothetical protein [Methylacidiphilum kamchatkense]QDQ41755.1 hypothetical protein kam1_505 [Methylacidiphilum kamchatkense Kam1]
MKLILGFIGITDVHQIIIDGTLFEKREVLLDKAMIEARNAAATF